jgi:adenosine kinase
MQERTGKSPEQLAKQVEAVIVTRGGQGSMIHTRQKTHEIPLAPARQLVDPTGCGDAYRGGLLYGMQQGFDWDVTGRIASLMGSIKIEHAGTQNHGFSQSDFAARFHETFGFNY